MEIVLFSADLSAELARLLLPDWAAPSEIRNMMTFLNQSCVVPSGEVFPI